MIEGARSSSSSLFENAVGWQAPAIRAPRNAEEAWTLVDCLDSANKTLFRRMFQRSLQPAESSEAIDGYDIDVSSASIRVWLADGIVERLERQLGFDDAGVVSARDLDYVPASWIAELEAAPSYDAAVHEVRWDD